MILRKKIITILVGCILSSNILSPMELQQSLQPMEPQRNNQNNNDEASVENGLTILQELPKVLQDLTVGYLKEPIRLACIQANCNSLSVYSYQDRPRIAVQSGSMINIYDAQTGNLVKELEIGWPPDTKAICGFCRDEQEKMYISTADGQIKLFNLATNECEQQLNSGFIMDGINDRSTVFLRMTDDDRLIVARNTFIKVFNSLTGECVQKLELLSPVKDISIVKINEKHKIIAQLENYRLELWDIDTFISERTLESIYSFGCLTNNQGELLKIALLALDEKAQKTIVIENNNGKKLASINCPKLDHDWQRIEFRKIMFLDKNHLFCKTIWNNFNGITAASYPDPSRVNYSEIHVATFKNENEVSWQEIDEIYEKIEIENPNGSQVKNQPLDFISTKSGNFVISYTSNEFFKDSIEVWGFSAKKNDNNLISFTTKYKLNNGPRSTEFSGGWWWELVIWIAVFTCLDSIHTMTNFSKSPEAFSSAQYAPPDIK